MMHNAQDVDVDGAKAQLLSTNFKFPQRQWTTQQNRKQTCRNKMLDYMLFIVCEMYGAHNKSSYVYTGLFRMEKLLKCVTSFVRIHFKW